MDLSALSMNSLAWANAVARARSAELRAFHVVVTKGVVAPERLGSLERGEMMTKLREALVTIDSENSLTGAAVRQGDPGTQILRFAKSMSADVIVMGAAGAERPTRPMGSVTATVVARSDCPVLIVPTGRQIDRSTSRGVQTDSVCGRSGAIFRQRHQASALARMGDTRTRLVRVCHDRTKSVCVRDSDPIIGGDPAEATRGATLKCSSSRESRPPKSSGSPRRRTWMSF